MMYIVWFIGFFFNLCFSILCYLTNWFVIFFADNRGELHGILHLWQTWDDSLDVEWFVKEKVPKFLRYDFDKHYESSRETTEALMYYNRDKGCVIDREVPFTNIELIQRYLCRVLWLYRNNGYGFAFYLFGMDCVGTELWHTKGSWYDFYWNDYCFQFIGKWKIFEVMAGWKLPRECRQMTRSMVAGRVLIRWNN